MYSTNKLIIPFGYFFRKTSSDNFQNFLINHSGKKPHTIPAPNGFKYSNFIFFIINDNLLRKLNVSCITLSTKSTITTGSR